MLTLSTIIKHIMLLTSEAKLATLYYSCKLATPLPANSHSRHYQQHHSPRPNMELINAFIG